MPGDVFPLCMVLATVAPLTSTRHAAAGSRFRLLAMSLRACMQLSELRRARGCFHRWVAWLHQRRAVREFTAQREAATARRVMRTWHAAVSSVRDGRMQTVMQAMKHAANARVRAGATRRACLGLVHMPTARHKRTQTYSHRFSRYPRACICLRPPPSAITRWREWTAFRLDTREAGAAVERAVELRHLGKAWRQWRWQYTANVAVRRALYVPLPGALVVLLRQCRLGVA